MADLQSLLVSFFAFLGSLPLANIPFSVLDVVIVVIVLFYAYEGLSLGFFLAFTDLLSFILAFLIALKGYSALGSIISEKFAIPQGFANAGSFFAIALISEILLNVLFRHFIRRLRRSYRLMFMAKKLSVLDRYLGVVPGMASAFIVLSFLFTVIVALPSSPVLKQTITNSLLGSRLVTHAAIAEKTLNDVFGGALHETLNFLTIEPESNESLALYFTVPSPLVDSASEREMLLLINQERGRVGLPPLSMDTALRTLARDYAQAMLQGGYFSHYDPNGASPFDRMDRYGIVYLSAGENLALAPNTTLAMQGLMNSPGHRANILSPDFRKIGVGVMDGGVYGKMFVQEFTD
jgi:uncharacterized protein YkwD